MTKIVNFSRQRPWIAALLCIIALGIPIAAYALTGAKGLNPYYRTKEFCHRIQIPTGANVTAGEDNVIVASTINAVTSVSVNDLDSGAATLGTLAYPATLTYDIVDNPDDDTPTCTSVVVTGFDQFGEQRQETITNLLEAGASGNIAWGRIKSVRATGCSGATDAGDLLWIGMSGVVGLRTKVKSYLDVEAACIHDAATNWRCMDPNNGAATDAESLTNTTYHTLNITTAGAWGNGFSLANNADPLCIRVRPLRPTE